MNAQIADRSVFTASATAILFAAMPVASFAQVSVPSAGTSGAGDIVVTAQRREQRLQDVPINVTALSGDQLAKRGAVDTQDLSKVVPGVITSEFGNSPSILNINIRGVAQLDYADHQEAPNAVYMDGAYISFPGATGIGLFDIERVEVLTGPQGTLFGRNATGGLLQIISRKPTETFGGYLQTEYGSYNQSRTEGALNLPVTSGLSVRVAALYNRQDGYVRNSLGKDAGQDKSFSGRGQIQWKISDDTSNNLEIFGSRTPKIAAGVYSVYPVAPNPDNRGLFETTNGPLFDANCAALGYGTPPAGSTNCAGYMKTGDPRHVDADPAGYFKRAIVGGTNTFSTRIGSATLSSITNYLHIDKEYQEHNDSSPVNLFTYTSRQKARQISQELRLNGSLPRFRWQAGAYYLNVSGDYDVVSDLSGSYGATGAIAFSQKTHSISAFGQADYDITDQLTFTAGARWTRDKKIFRAVTSCDLDPAGCAAVGFAANGTPIAGSFKDDEYSGKALLSWKPSADLLLYAGINRGVKGGLVLAPAPPGPGTTFDNLLIKPEKLTDYEGGFKSRFLDRKVTLNGSLFYYHYDNFQAYKWAGFTATLFNAQARNYGGELQLDVRATPTLTIGAQAAALHTKILDVTLPDGSISNQQAAYAPHLVVGANVRKDVVTGIGTFFFQGDAIRVGSRYFTTVNDEADRAGAYVTGSLTIGYEDNRKLWSAQIRIQNINNEYYPIYQSQVASIAGYGIRTFAPPRWVSFQVKRNF